MKNINKLVDAKSEIRNETFVTEKMKKIWAIEIDMLLKVQEICEKENLKYFAIGGTLLGAIRHNGFIPWDDDIDIVMPRSDYNKFILKADNYIQKPYIIQKIFDKDKKFFKSFIKIRNIETTAIGKEYIDHRLYYGIFLDIFPLDGVPTNLFSKIWHGSNVYFFRKLLENYYMSLNKSFSGKLKHKIISFIIDNIINSSKCYDKWYKHLTAIDYESAKLVGTIEQRYFDKRLYWNKEDFNDFIVKPFEKAYIRIPIGYKNILRKHYGDDFMQLPEIKNRKAHDFLFFDPDNSYKKYILNYKKQEEDDEKNKSNNL